jgi:hypothetical protein
MREKIMKRCVIPCVVILVLGLSAGCSYFRKPDEPPPLPPIEEKKPPLKMKSDYFKAFPWSALSKPHKDGNDPDSTLYSFKEGDTLESVAEKEMGSRGAAAGLADYNELSSPNTVTVGEKIVIPFPIVGVSSHIRIKGKSDKEFGPSETFDVEFKKADQYKMVFESNVDGYLYVLREGAKEGVAMLFPASTKTSTKKSAKGKKGKAAAPETTIVRESNKVEAFRAVEVPRGVQGRNYDSKNVGDRVVVFLSLKPIPALEDLKEKQKIRREDVQDVMRNVKEGEVFSDGPYRLLRISDPSEILGFTLNING